MQCPTRESLMEVERENSNLSFNSIHVCPSLTYSRTVIRNASCKGQEAPQMHLLLHMSKWNFMHIGTSCMDEMGSILQ